MGQAFDEAWAEIVGNFGSEPQDVEKARRRLAKALLSVANEDSRRPRMTALRRCIEPVR